MLIEREMTITVKAVSGHTYSISFRAFKFCDGWNIDRKSDRKIRASGLDWSVADLPLRQRRIIDFWRAAILLQSQSRLKLLEKWKCGDNKY